MKNCRKNKFNQYFDEQLKVAVYTKICSVSIKRFTIYILIWKEKSWICRMILVSLNLAILKGAFVLEKAKKRYLVKDIISKPMGCLSKEARLCDAVRFFQDTKLTIAPIVEKNGRLIGVFTKSHLFKSLLNGKSLEEKVVHYMTKNVVTVNIDEPAEDVFRRLPSVTVGQFVVVDNEYKAVGILAHINVVRSLLETTSVMAREQQAIIQAMHNGMLVIDAAGIISMINPSAVKLFGLTGIEVVGRSIEEILPKSICSQMLQKVLETGESIIGEKDTVGSATVMANCSPITKNDKVIGAVCILQDVTEIEHLAKELQSVKRVYQTLETVLDIAYDGFVIVNKEGQVEWCNQPFVDYIGLKREEIMNQDVDRLLGDSEIKLSASTGKAFRGHIKSSGGRYAIVSCQPIYIDGQVEGAVGKIIFRELDELKDLVKRIDMLENQVSYYQQELSKVTGAKFTIDDIITVNERMKLIKKEAYQAARSDATILLRGESGTGKELFAHAIHNASYRFEGPFLKINCAAVPEHLLESEFFGYEDGAFTGARKGGKPGKFELANGGTMFLDEIGDMPKSLQAKLLRVLEDNEVTRLGGVKSTKVDVRIIAATNRDLEAMVKNGEFREDLYYRLNVITIEIPPLRQRLDDIPVLVEILTNKYNTINRKHVSGIDPTALSMLQSYRWPGNIRELENVIERAVSLNIKGLIYPEHLPEYIKTSFGNSTPCVENEPKTSYKQKIRSTEKEVLEQALKEAQGNKTKAAKLLGISRTMLYQKLNAYGLRNKYIKSNTYNSSLDKN